MGSERGGTNKEAGTFVMNIITVEWSDGCRCMNTDFILKQPKVN